MYIIPDVVLFNFMGNEPKNDYLILTQHHELFHLEVSLFFSCFQLVTPVLGYSRKLHPESWVMFLQMKKTKCLAALSSVSSNAIAFPNLEDLNIEFHCDHSINCLR